MNIGVVVDNTFFNDERVKRESSILKEKYGKVHVLCFDFSGKQAPVIDGMIVETIRIKRKFKDLLFFVQNWMPFYEKMWAKHISDFISKYHLDIIHAHDLYMSRSAYMGIRKSGKDCRLILDLHENYPEVVKSYSWTKGIRRPIARPSSWKKKEFKYLSLPDRIIMLSESFKNEMIKEYGLQENKIAVFPNVPDLKVLESYRKKTDIIADGFEHPLFFYFGVIGKRRGIFETLNVFKEYIRKGHKGNLLLIGPVDKYDRKRFFAEIASPAVASKIIYKPWINIEDLPSHMEISDVCLAPFEKNPQHESGISNKIYQYMYGKKPLISSNCKPQQELIEKYNFGLIFSSEQEYLNAMIRLGGDIKLQEEMGDNAYQALLNHCNLENYKHIILDLYEEISTEISSA